MAMSRRAGLRKAQLKGTAYYKARNRAGAGIQTTNGSAPAWKEAVLAYLPVKKDTMALAITAVYTPNDMP